ncbi:MAG: polysaccharide deacetylase family protein [Planctomycetes bacterium]|nr:polysaccharide deacetylase family protein [Planctomycetota bacterium]
MRNLVILCLLLFLISGNSFAYAEDKKEPPPVPIITDIAKEKATPEWFSFTDVIGDFVVLTFDDGPFRSAFRRDLASGGQANNNGWVDHTGIILDILKRENLKAAFFILGFQLDTANVKTGETYQKYCQWLGRMFAEGHTVAIHDRKHIQFYKQSRKDMDASFAYTKTRVREICGQELSCYVRSPGGSVSREALQYLRQNGYKHIFWHINSEPEQYLTPKQILKAIIKELNRGKRGIIMMHDRNASEYLEELLRWLKANKIKVITLEEWERRYGLPETPFTPQKVKFD